MNQHRSSIRNVHSSAWSPKFDRHSHSSRSHTNGVLSMKSRTRFGIFLASLGAIALAIGIANLHPVPVLCELGQIACGAYFMFTCGEHWDKIND